MPVYRRTVRTFAFAFVSLIFVCFGASGQSVPQLLSTLSGTTQFGETAVSPDGHWLAWVIALRNKDNTSSRNSEIWLVDLTKAGAAPRKIENSRGAPHAESGVAFSPDSRQVAYLSDREKSGQLQLFVEAVEGGSARRLTSLTGFLASPRWSPDGERSRSFLRRMRRARRTARAIHQRFRSGGGTHLRTTSHACGSTFRTVKPSTPADTYVYEYDWAPDSVASRIRHRRGTGTTTGGLRGCSLDFDFAAAVKEIVRPELQIATPDGRPMESRSPTSAA